MIRSLKNLGHLLVAIGANAFFGFPSKDIYIIGVTGTDGKTTTASLIYHILKTAGKKSSLITTIGAQIGHKKYDVGLHTTTPSSFFLQSCIKKAKAEASEFLVIEITSHGLDQNRVFGIEFDIAVLTNISHEHLDYHKTYGNYAKAKSKLLKMADMAIINRDDESYEFVKSKVPAKGGAGKSQKSKLVSYGLGKNSDVNPSIFPFKTKLAGDFNKYNALAAIAVCQRIGIHNFKIRQGLLSFTPPVGRQEIVHDGLFLVMIDFAHTPKSFKELLPQVKKNTEGRLIHVFGAAGNRDASKRPLMGKISSRYADIIVLAPEDPRSETVSQINREIATGIRGMKFIKNLFSFIDRQRAIDLAVEMAREGDTVLITGKGHEKSMNYGRLEIPWSEHRAVARALKLANRQ